MEYENMRMHKLKSLAREHRLRGYSRMRKAELVALLQNSPPPGQSCASTSPISNSTNSNLGTYR